jgi:hypothetical protein
LRSKEVEAKKNVNYAESPLRTAVSNSHKEKMAKGSRVCQVEERGLRFQRSQNAQVLSAKRKNGTQSQGGRNEGETSPC